jgi:hypothetical protein
MVCLEEWFLDQRDERVAEGFFTPLQEDFYRAYHDSGVVFRSQRVYSLEAIVQVTGEEIHPHLTYLEGLADLLGRSEKYIPSWIREFYASLWVDPAHRYLHFAFRGRDYRIQSVEACDILRIPFQHN